MLSFLESVRTLVAALAALAALGLAAPLPAQAPRVAAASDAVDPERLAIAGEIIELAYPPERRQALFTNAMDAMMAQMRSAMADLPGRQLDSGAQAIVDRHLERVRAAAGPLIAETSPALFAAMARGYARQFDQGELVQIRAFVATPAGAKFVRRSAELLSDPDVAAVNADHFRRTLAMVQPLEADLRRELTDYFAKDAAK